MRAAPRTPASTGGLLPPRRDAGRGRYGVSCPEDPIRREGPLPTEGQTRATRAQHDRHVHGVGSTAELVPERSASARAQLVPDTDRRAKSRYLRAVSVAALLAGRAEVGPPLERWVVAEDVGVVARPAAPRGGRASRDS